VRQDVGRDRKERGRRGEYRSKMIYDGERMRERKRTKMIEEERDVEDERGRERD